jgi:hypothetical protein
MNDTLASIVVGLASLVSFICFILVIIQMFQRGATGMGIACIALTLCCGLGGLVAFIYGWVKAREWSMTRLMTVWTVAFAIDVVAGIVNPAPFQPLRDTLHI